MDEPLASLRRLARTARGPLGRSALVHLNPLSSNVAVSCASSLVTSLSISRNAHSARATTLVALIERNATSLADGGWLVLALATALATTRQRADHGDPGEGAAIPTSVLLAGHQLALTWCLDFLTRDFVPRGANDPAYAASCTGERPHPVCAVQLSNLPVLLALLRSQLASKQAVLQLRADEQHHLAVLCVQAFLAGLGSPSGNAAAGAFASNIRVHEVLGRPVADSSIFEGVVLDIPLPMHVEIAALCDVASRPRAAVSSGLKTYVRLTTVLYNINLTFAASEHFSKEVLINQADAADDSDGNAPSPTYQAGLYALMRTLVDAWSGAGVTLVAAQKVIHPYLKQKCLERGILPLERLSIRHMDAVQQAAGGVVLSGIGSELVRLEVLGSLARLEERLIGKRRFIFLTLSPSAAASSSSSLSSATSGSVVTLLLSSSSPPQLSELAALLPRMFKQLAHLLRLPLVCAGAGATEMSLACEIRHRVEARRQSKRALYTKLRGDLRARAANAVANPLAPLEFQLYTAHLSRLGAQDRLLSRACLQLAEALEDVACVAAWNNQPTAAKAGGLLFEEVKAQLRRFYMPETATLSTPAAASVPMSHSPPRPRPSLPIASSDPFASDLDDDAGYDVTAASASSPAPILPTDHTPPAAPPIWNAQADWQLDFEARSSPSSLPASMIAPSIPAATEPPPDPHALYGFHASSPSPTPVFRVDPATSALVVDSASTVLDYVYVTRASLQIAVEAAAVLLRVDHVVPESDK